MATSGRRPAKALIFDLDGTLVDTVYPHVLAWQQALLEAKLPVDAWRVHRWIGMSGSLLMRAVAREVGRELNASQAEALEKRHAELLHRLVPRPRALPGAVELLKALRAARVPHGIATSGREPDPFLKPLQVPRTMIVVDGNEVAHAKPEPDLFLVCRKKLRVPAERCFIVGDAVWDLLAARRAGMLGVGLLSGGYGEEELYRAGAFRVYRDPAELHRSLDELGILS